MMQFPVPPIRQVPVEALTMTAIHREL